MRSLLLSLISLTMSLTMLVGSTFAWFTDSVVSKNNIITSGNLDVELEYSTDMVAWNKVTETTNIFKENTLWEPGYTEVVYLRVSNLGSLALKYQLGIGVDTEVSGKNVYGKDFNLSDYIEYGVVEDVTTKYADRDAARTDANAATKLSQIFEEEYSLVGKTDTVDQDVFALVVYMPETVGNDANHDGETVPSINLALTVLATQATVESDSFGSDYDAKAEYEKLPVVVKVTNVNELLDALANAEEGTTIDAEGVTADINTIGTSFPNGMIAYNIPGGVTIKKLTVTGSYRGGNTLLFEGEPNQEIVFEECTFGNTTRIFMVGGQANGVDSVKYNNCTFKGQVITNFVDNTDGVAEFNNCTFTKSGSGSYHYIEAMGGKHVFNDCTFDYTGVSQSSMGVLYSGRINVYSEDEYSTEVILNNCERINCGTHKYGPNSTLTNK